MGDLSQHFSRSEFRCHGFGHAGHRNHATPVDARLVALLERIRQEHGGPVRVVSGHRCAWWNRQVGGAGASQHMKGTAADLATGVITGARARALGASGVGTKGGWATHVDVRAKPARWTYD